MHVQDLALSGIDTMKKSLRSKGFNLYLNIRIILEPQSTSEINHIKQFILQIRKPINIELKKIFQGHTQVGIKAKTRTNSDQNFLPINKNI